MTHLSKLLADAGIPEDLKRQIREAAGKDEDESKRRLRAMLPLFEEARDAITTIPLATARLRGLRLDLADRMDDVGVPERWTALLAAQEKP